ncbi:hypothetical protein HYH03_008726 [Edaphochlamys debaryana]|uniref:Uncharacterized protein n=1 Tax=Edaphochlamys debaryana TaxID=47281 RepID=A0A836BZ60_9CHLO|nr:hypothetical protein HYH03_008726 [Edaphochlamys debaryana]|eukprot:KAG2493063.1 hypothetical protein HYH03_008726 [Edaphochlamys debaryana]
MGCGASSAAAASDPADRGSSANKGTGDLIHSSRQSYVGVPLLEMYGQVEEDLFQEAQARRVSRQDANTRLYGARGAFGLQAKGALMNIYSTPEEPFRDFLADCPEYVDMPSFGCNASNVIPGTLMLYRASELQALVEAAGRGEGELAVAPNTPLLGQPLTNMLKFKAIWGSRLLGVILRSLRHPALGRVAITQPLLAAACGCRVFNWGEKVDPVFGVLLEAGANPNVRNSLNMTPLMLLAISVVMKLDQEKNGEEGCRVDALATALETARMLLRAGADPGAVMIGFGSTRARIEERAWQTMLPSDLNRALPLLERESYTVAEALDAMLQPLRPLLQRAHPSVGEAMEALAALLRGEGAGSEEVTPGAGGGEGAAGGGGGGGGEGGASGPPPAPLRPEEVLTAEAAAVWRSGVPEGHTGSWRESGGAGAEAEGAGPDRGEGAEAAELSAVPQASAGAEGGAAEGGGAGAADGAEEDGAGGQQQQQRQQQRQRQPRDLAQVRSLARDVSWPWVQAMGNVAWAISQVAMGSTTRQRRAVLAALQAQAPFSLPPMAVVSIGQLRELGHIPRFSLQADAAADPAAPASASSPPFRPLPVDQALAAEGSVVVFVSHRWLGRGCPDDDKGTKLRQVYAIAEHIAKHRGVRPEQVYMWLDYSVVDQSNPMPGVQALPIYIACCDEFVYVTHSEYWQRAWCLTEQFMHWKLATSDVKHKLIPGPDGGGNMRMETESSRQRPPDPTYGKLFVEADRVALATMTSLLSYDERS